MQVTYTQYADLTEALQHFLHGVYPLLIVESTPGLGKTELVKDLFHTIPRHCWLSGRVTPVLFYTMLYQYQDCPLVLDDVQSLLDDKQCVELLKAVCSTSDQDSHVSWLTKTTLPEGVPHQFATSSHVLVLTNRWNSTNIHYGALADRGLHVHFQPAKAEIHRYAHSLVDPEIWQWFNQYLPLLRDVSLRPYVLAQKMQGLGLYWQHVLPRTLGLSEGEQCYIALELASPHSTIDEKLNMFLAKYPDMHPRTYLRIHEQLQKGDL